MSTPYVNEQAAADVREIERRILNRSQRAGIIFISVTAVPAENGNSHTFYVRLGLDKNLNFNAMTSDLFIRTVFKEEIEHGWIFHTASYRGICATNADESHEGARQPPS